MVLKILVLLLIASDAEAFVLLSGPSEARLPVSEEAPKVSFQLSLDPPAISEKAAFADGAYADLSDEDFWLKLVELAMEPWTKVADAYVELEATSSANATLEKNDGIYSIVVGETNLTTAAYADPNVEEKTIIDCDIAVSKRSARATSLAFTLMHEIGHCLGLGHNHSDYTAVMGYARSDRSLTLGLDDEAGLIFLYPFAAEAKSKELASCGTLSGGQSVPMASVVAYLLPLSLGLMAWFRRRPRRFRDFF